VPKVHNKPIKRSRKGSNKESKRQPKTPWSGAPDSVRCTSEPNTELLTFGKMGGRYAIIHQTVQCASGATATSRPTVDCKRIQCATVRARDRASTDGAPDSLEAPPVRAPTVRNQRPADVAGAPDCPVRHATAAFQRPLLVVGSINTPTTPTFNCIQVFHLQHLTRAITFNSRHNQRDQILSQVRNHSKSNSD
jgi:hypothetical protein